MLDLCTKVANRLGVLGEKAVKLIWMGKMISNDAYKPHIKLLKDIPNVARDSVFQMVL